MNKPGKSIAVIGAGPMGLMTSYELLKKGYQVDLYERDDRIGGMSASFDLDGMRIERYYHFICKTDYPLFELLKEFNLESKLHWRETKMGFYYDGKLYHWGDPLSLIKFPKLDFVTKFRYGLHVFYSKNIRNWNKLDKIGANEWIKKWIGKKGYRVLWDSLFKLKFYEYEHSLSAAWIASRIQRVAKSRKNIFKEELGFLQGGSDTLLNCLEDKIIALGGKIYLRSQVDQVASKNNQVTGVQINGEHHPYETVISTIPTPFVPNLVPGIPEETRKQIASIANVGVVCVVLKLKSAYSQYFWMNINDKKFEIPGMIEYTNLNPMSKNILYIPYYMPKTHHKYQWSDQQFRDEVCSYLESINPKFNKDWILASHVSRYGFAQTVCTPNFFEKLPPMKSSLNGFYMADTAFYYPEDRSISESVRIGKQLAECADQDF